MTSAMLMAQEPMSESFMMSQPVLGDAAPLIGLELVSRRDGEVFRVLAWRVSLSTIKSNVVVGGQDVPCAIFHATSPLDPNVPNCRSPS